MIRRAGPMACALALGALGGVLLGGCGGATKTVTVSGAPAASAGAQAGAHTSSTASTPAGATPTTTTSGASGATGQTSTTHTAPAPAFLHSGGQSAEQAASAEATAAAAVVSAHGYTAGNLSDYHPNQTLRVLVGTRNHSTAGHNQLAFFFLDNRYLGTDSSQPSAAVRVVSQSDTEVTLAYALYRPRDTLCCPSGGQAVVHFQLDNGTLTPLNPIPPTSSSAALSRQ